MIPELGHVALIISFLMAITLLCVPFVGIIAEKPELVRLAKPLAWGHAFFVGISFLVLGYAFLSCDFSVAYVADNANTALPWGYRLCALWASHE